MHSGKGQKIIKESHSSKTIVFCAVLITATLLNSCASREEPAVEVKANETMQIETSQGSFSLEPTVVSYPEESFDDPLEFINRPIFAFNDVVFRYALIPVAEGYQKVVPEPARKGVSNFFSNLREPLNFANQVFQLNGEGAVASVSRFLINSTVGLFGLFDPAEDWLEIKEQKATLNQTLASYNVGNGAFLVLPFLGQTDTRNGFSTAVESVFHPINQLTDAPTTYYIQGFSSIHEFAPNASSYEKLETQANDPYVFFRNLYLQGVMRDEQFAPDAQPTESFELNPHSTGHTQKEVNEAIQPASTEKTDQ